MGVIKTFTGSWVMRKDFGIGAEAKISRVNNSEGPKVVVLMNCIVE